MNAQQYNASAVGRVWKVIDLPDWLSGIDPGSKRFAAEVVDWQKQHDLEVDGCLGRLTLASMLEHDLDFGPVHLSNVKIVPTQRQEKKRAVNQVVGVGIHTTGSGIIIAARKRAESGVPESEMVKRVMRNILGNPESYSSSCYVFPDGETWLTIPVDEKAVHGGISDLRTIYDGGFENWKRMRGTCISDIRVVDAPTRYDGWKRLADQEGFESPFDLCSDPNLKLWAFDLVPELKNGVESFTDIQFKRAAEIVSWAGRRFGFALSFKTVLEHKSWNPICRWPWDPGANFTRKRLGDELRKLKNDQAIRLGGDDR